MSLVAELAEVGQDEQWTGQKGEKDVLSMSRGGTSGKGRSRGLRAAWLSPDTAPWWQWLQCLPLHSGTEAVGVQPGDGEHSSDWHREPRVSDGP